ncbi:MAG: hypothetical protein WC340_07005 [Kiritimatiellia bacterium]
MNKLIITALAAFGCFSLACASENIIRPIDNARVWQTVLNPSEPLRWPWINNTDSAVLTITSHWNNAANTFVVNKTENDLYGTFALEAPPAGKERLYSVVLEYQAGETVVKTKYARLAYIAGVQGRGIEVVKTGRNSTDDSVTILAYDREWSAASLAASGATLTVTPPGDTIELVGTSGYEPIKLAQGSSLLELAFDGDVVWSANAAHLNPGIVIIIR